MTKHDDSPIANADRPAFTMGVKEGTHKSAMERAVHEAAGIIRRWEIAGSDQAYDNEPSDPFAIRPALAILKIYREALRGHRAKQLAGYHVAPLAVWSCGEYSLMFGRKTLQKLRGAARIEQRSIAHRLSDLEKRNALQAPSLCEVCWRPRAMGQARNADPVFPADPENCP